MIWDDVAVRPQVPTGGQPEKRSVYTSKMVARPLEEVEGSTLERAGRRRFNQEGLRGVGGKAFCACRAGYGPHCDYRLSWMASRPPVGPGIKGGLGLDGRSAARGGPLARVVREPPRVSHTRSHRQSIGRDECRRRVPGCRRVRACRMGIHAGLRREVVGIEGPFLFLY